MASTTSTERQLLPTNVKPLHYDLKLTPDMAAFTFNGEVTVRLQIVQATDTIVLHVRDVKIQSAFFLEAADKTGEVTYDVAMPESATITFPAGAVPAAGTEARLRMTFTGELNDLMAGFYRSKCTNGAGEEMYIATTQFEPTDARRAFPCWDEPALKAEFALTLVIPDSKKYPTVLSNMDPETVTPADDGSITYKFPATPKMSSYLLAFVIGDFDHVEDKTKNGVRMRVYTPKGKAEQGRFALKMATATLDYYTDWFGVGYPLPKQDMIAIPDFSAGAMENWGLITYRETALLIDEANSPVAQKGRVAYVVAHELAHQWFGNLVTMEWWRELWLNEGFATFVGNQAVDVFHPNWQVWSQFISDYTGRALSLDSLESSHPIEVEVRTSAQVNEIFDAISYCKGAAVIRMLSEFISPAKFQAGLNIYLKQHSYGNAVTTNLWDALKTASGVDVASFMSTWTAKTGFPVVGVSEQADGKLLITQKRFLASGGVPATEADTLWHVPLKFATSVGVAETHTVVTEASQVVDVPIAVGASWIIANSNYTGVYRVRYSDELLEKLATALAAGSLSVVDRLGLQIDAFALAKAGMLGTDRVLHLAGAFKTESDFAVWSDLAANLKGVASVWSGEPNYGQLKSFLAGVFQPTVEKLGWDVRPGEDDRDAMLRATILGAAGSMDSETIFLEAKKRFTAGCNGGTVPLGVPADLRGVVYRMLVGAGDASDFEAVLQVYKDAEMQEEKVRALSALGCAKDVALVRRSLEFALSEDVRSQDCFYVIASASSTPHGRTECWDFVKSNWAMIEKKFANGQFLMQRIVSLAIGAFGSHSMADEIQQFFKDHPVPGAERSIAQGLEGIRARADWVERDRAGVANFLSAL